MNTGKTDEWMKNSMFCWQIERMLTSVARENWRNTCHVTEWAKSPWLNQPVRWLYDQKYSYKTGKNELKNCKKIFGVW